MSSPTELYRRYRPASFKEVIGQPDACRILCDLGKKGRVPHALLFTGPSGCGKTTLARILQRKLQCVDADFFEVNCADFRGIDMVREIRTRMSLRPLGEGKCRIWLIDECHQLSKDAQNALLKMLEDTPDHVYFMLATTDPEKLLTTIRTRCTEIKLKAMSAEALKVLVQDVLKKEGKNVTEAVVERLVEHSEGSARKILVLLNAVIGLESEEEQLSAIMSSDHRAKAIELARMLMAGKGWKEVALVVKQLDDEPETLRRMILGYASAVLLNAPNEKAFVLIDIFKEHFYDSGRAGLVAACYAAVSAGRR